MISLNKLIVKVDACVNERIAKYEGEINLLCTIPGIDRKSAIAIISEIGTDMSQFGSSKRLCCWAGLTSGNSEFAGKKKSARISRASVYLKPALAQVAHAAVKDKANPSNALKCEYIARCRGKNRAIIAIGVGQVRQTMAFLTASAAFLPFSASISARPKGTLCPAEEPVISLPSVMTAQSVSGLAPSIFPIQ